MENEGKAYTHTQETTGFGSRNDDLGHEHSDETTPRPATTNEIDGDHQNRGMHGRETRQSTQIVEAEGLRRLRDQDGTASRG